MDLGLVAARAPRVWRSAFVVLTFMAGACASRADDPLDAERDGGSDAAVKVVRSALAIDSSEVAPVAAYSTALKLRAAYAGAAIRVRRASDNAELDVGFTATNRVNASALPVFCGSSDCFLVNLYDQSGNAQDLGQNVLENQPKMYDGAARALVGGHGYPVISTTVPGKSVVRGGTLGLSGNPAFTIAYAGRYYRGVTGQNEVTPIRICGVTSTTNNGIGFGYAEPGLGPYVFTGGGYSAWAKTGHESETQCGVLRHAAGTPMGASTFRFNGVDLGAPVDGVNSSLPFEIIPSFTMLGKAYGNNNDSGTELSSVLVWDTVLGDHDVALVEQLLAPDDADAAPVAAYSVARKLRTEYAGAAFRVRRASDNAVLQVGFLPSGSVDTGMLLSFCGSADCFLDALYDQSGNARDLSQATVARQIKMYTGATHALVGGGPLPTIAAPPGQSVERSDPLGFTGNPAFTVAYAGRYASGTDFTAPIAIAGGLAIGSQIAFGMAPTYASVYFGGGNINWNATDLSQPHVGVVTHAASTNIDTAAYRMNDVSKPLTYDLNGNRGFQFVSTAPPPPAFWYRTVIGHADGDPSTSIVELNTVVLWNTVISDSKRALVQQQLDPALLGYGSNSCYGAPGAQALAPWPMVGLCPMHRAQSPAKGPQTNARPWTPQQIGSGNIRGSVAIAADGTIFVSSSGRLAAVNPSTGAQTLTASARTPGSSVAIGSDGTVYSISSFNSLEARHPSTWSTPKWTFGLGSSASTGPVIGPDGTIYATSSNGKLRAITPAGTEKWPALTFAAITGASPAIGGDGTIYVGADDGLHAVNPNGTLKWNLSLGSNVFVRTTPAIGADGTIYLGTDSNKLVAVTPGATSGTIAWTFTTAGAVRSAPAVASDGTIYFGSRDHKVYAVNANGTQKWVRSTGSNVDSSPAIGSDGVIYVGSDDSRLYALRPADGTVLFSYNEGNAIRGAVAIGRDGTVYAGADDAKLVAIGPGSCAASDTTCDGKDDDCNGAIDEDFVSTASSCGAGMCARTAATTCVDGVVRGSTTCTPGSPGASDATCNGVDENCNGQNDEGYAGGATTCGVGACMRSGSNVCSNGTVQNSCVAGTPATTSDATCDGIDDDCNGTVDDLCAGGNLATNGTFETGVTPNQGLRNTASGVVDDPDLLQWERTDTNGSAGALRVKVTPVAGQTLVHNTGAFIAFAPPVPAGSWISVSFRAKSLSGSTLLNIIRSFGGGTPRRVRITGSWASYQVYMQVGYDTSGLVFNLVHADLESQQPLDGGEFLLDDVDIRYVPPCTSTSCGAYSPDAIFGSSLRETWDSRLLVTADGTGAISAWKGTRRGLLLQSVAPHQPQWLGAATTTFKGANVVSTNAEPTRSLEATFEQDLIEAGARPYVAVVAQLRHLVTDYASDGGPQVLVDLRAMGSYEHVGPGLFVAAAPYDPAPVVYSTYSSNGTSDVHDLVARQTTVPTLYEAWLAADGLHFSQNGVEQSVPAGENAPLSEALRFLAVGSLPSALDSADADFAQVVVATEPTAQQRAQYYQYVHDEWGVPLCTASTACAGGDSCCPEGCTHDDDSDCNAVPSSCDGVDACVGGDGCCPESCAISGYDGDCPPMATCTATDSCIGNGHPGCFIDADCEPGLSCGYGVGSRFGLPTNVGVCWNPALCATAASGSPLCGSAASYCGICCVPSCIVAGEPDGCGGTCQACQPGADSDHDGVLDCTEANDGNPETDPNLFGGIAASLGSGCYEELADANASSADLAACFTARESHALRSGWMFNTEDTDACQPGFHFDLPWQQCGADFTVRYSGGVRLASSGIHCFSLFTGDQQQYARLLFDGETINSQHQLCVYREAGVYPIEWYYSTTDDSGSMQFVLYCDGGSSSCDPTGALPAAMLQPSVPTRCSPGAACSAQCPCAVPGGICSTSDQCAGGLQCRTDVSVRFGLAAGTGVCWDPVCDDMQSPGFECGTPTSYCGSVCPSCTANCSGKSCGGDGCFGSCGDECSQGQLGCESDDDCADGLACIVRVNTPNVCLPEICGHPGTDPCSDPANAGRQTVCGTCAACSPNCNGRVCGDAPNGCGSCDTSSLGPSEYCTSEGTVEPSVLGVSNTLSLDGLDDDEPAGTLSGTFEVSPRGQATYTIPLQLPPGRNGIEPQLSLAYNSDGVNGYLGVGWGLSGLSAIQRCPQTKAQDGKPAPVRYTPSDRFCLDGNRLVLENGSDTYGGNGVTYHTEVDNFSRIRSYRGSETDDSDVGYFVVETRDGRRLYYEFRVQGTTANIVGFDAQGAKVFPARKTQSWLLTRVEDRFGNTMRIRYREALSAVVTEAIDISPSSLGAPVREYYPLHIDYTSHGQRGSDRRIDFDYKNRADVLAGYQHGVRYERTKLLDRITAVVEGQPAFEYRFQYDEPGAREDGLSAVDQLHVRTTLASVQQCARTSLRPDAPLSCKEPTRFDYSEVTDTFLPDETGPTLPALPASAYGRPLTLDMDGNGKDDVLFTACVGGGTECKKGYEWRLLRDGQLTNTTYPRSLHEVDDTLVPAKAAVVDYDLDGRDDVIELTVDQQGRAGLRKLSLGQNGKLASEIVGPGLGAALDALLADVNGDGLKDLVTCAISTTPNSGGYEIAVRLRNASGGYGSAQVVDVGAGSCPQSIDVEGDGAQELLAGRSVIWPMTYAGTAFLEGSGRSNVLRYVVDVNGDGLDDIIDVDASVKTAGAPSDASYVTPPQPRSGWVGECPGPIAGCSVKTWLEVDHVLRWKVPVRTSYSVRTWINTGRGFIRHRVRRIDGVTTDEYLPKNSDGELEPSATDLSKLLRGQRAEAMRDLAATTFTFDQTGDGRADLFVQGELVSWPRGRAVFRSFGRPADFVFDADHDGVADMAWATTDRVLHIRRRNGSETPRLEGITDGLGAYVHIEYMSTVHDPVPGEESLATGPVYRHEHPDGCTFPVYCRFPRQTVVRRHDLRASADAPAERTYVYSYANWAEDLNGRGSLGFGERRILDRPRASESLAGSQDQLRTLSYENKWRESDLGTYPYVDRAYRRVDEWTAGDRKRVETLERTFDNEGEYRATRRPTSKSYFSRLSRQRRVLTDANADGSGAVVVSHDIFDFMHDARGNVTSATTTLIGVRQSKVFTVYRSGGQYDAQWLISVPDRVEVHDTSSGDELVSVRRFEYGEDPPPPNGRHVAPYTGRPDLVTTAPRFAPTLTVAYEYDEFGNTTKVTRQGAGLSDANGDGIQTRTTDIAYDDAEMFPARTTDANGHSVVVIYDQALGIPVKTIEDGRPGIPISRQAITDGFGRLRRIVEADGATTDVAYQRAGEGGWTERAAHTGAPSQEVHYDVFGRPVRTDVDGLTDVLTTETTYNALGLPESISRAHRDGADPDATTFEYDALGRRLAANLPDGKKVEGCYVANTACERDPLGHVSCEVSNGRGQLAYVVNPPAGTGASCIDVANSVSSALPPNDPPLANDLSTSRYVYDVFGRMSSIEDAAHHVTTYERDGNGAVNTVIDPDSGRWTYSYNAFGELEREVDPLGRNAVLRHDLLGRVTSRNESAGPEGDRVERFYWDYLDGAGFYGQPLTTISSDGITTAFAHDSVGRLQVMQKTIPTSATGGGDATITRTFDYDEGLKQLSKVTYSDDSGTLAELGYDYDRGYLKSIFRPGSAPGSDEPIWTAVDDDPYGQLATERFGNSVVETTRTYHPHTGRLNELRTRAGGADLSRWQHAYYDDGNLKTRTDLTPGSNRRTEYAYDERGRLERAETYLSSASPALRYLEAYGYDAVGNITSKHVLNADLGTDVTLAYDYAGGNDGSGGPNAIKRITRNTDGAWTQFHYSAAGDLESRTAGAQSALAIAYEARHLPRSVGSSAGSADSVALLYDASGVRARKTSPIEGETLYVDEAYSRNRAATAGGVIDRLVVHAGDRAVAEIIRDASGGSSVRYLHEDHLGSIEMVTNAQGGVYERRVHEAFGKLLPPISGSGTPFGTRIDYAGHERDADFNLIDMKARLYDPELGRFMTADPLAAQLRSQPHQSPYSYVRNRPTRLVDPLGLDERLPPPDSPLPPPGTPEPRPEPPMLGTWTQPPPSAPMGMPVEHKTVSARPSVSDAPSGALNARGETSTSVAPVNPAQAASLQFPDMVAFDTEGTAWINGERNFNETLLNYFQNVLNGARLPSWAFERLAVSSLLPHASVSALTRLLPALGESSSAVSTEVASNGERLAGTIRNVNPLGGRTNCVNCVIATHATLSGAPASALLSGPERISVLERAFGSTFGRIGGQAAIEAALRQAGPGAQGVVYGSRGPGQVGHVFNAINQNGVIRFLDGQTGGPASFQGFKEFLYMAIPR